MFLRTVECHKKLAIAGSIENRKPYMTFLKAFWSRLQDVDTMGVACISLCCQQAVKELGLRTDNWNSSRTIDNCKNKSLPSAVRPLWQAQNRKTIN